MGCSSLGPDTSCGERSNPCSSLCLSVLLLSSSRRTKVLQTLHDQNETDTGRSVHVVRSPAGLETRSEIVSRHTCFLCGVEVSFFLCFADVLLISYSLVSEPIGYLNVRKEETMNLVSQEHEAAYLRYGDATLSGEFFFRLFTGVRVGEVRVEVFVQDFGRLLRKVAPLSPRVQETGPQDHDSLASALLELYLD